MAKFRCLLEGDVSWCDLSNNKALKKKSQEASSSQKRRLLLLAIFVIVVLIMGGSWMGLCLSLGFRGTMSLTGVFLGRSVMVNESGFLEEVVGVCLTCCLTLGQVPLGITVNYDVLGG